MSARLPAMDDVAHVRPFERHVPPVIPVAMTALGLAVTAGVILAAQAMTHPSLVLPTVLVAAAVALEIAAVVLAVSIRPFAWTRFRHVGAWTLLAYVLQSSMIEWSFAKNHVPGGPMTLLTIGILVFATVVPFMIAFTVARYEAAPG